MKRLTCEMCGGTDLIKDGGVFVCQSCGCKYSVEEARKMMVEGTVEVQGVVQVSNAAQVSNLLNMARNAYDSKNYVKTEEFCDQALAMDDKNYNAWKLKAEAINCQTSSDNPRMLEAYNCLMTAYRVIGNSVDKKDRTHEIVQTFHDCIEGEIYFWLKQFESKRPTDIALQKVKNTYTNCRSMIKDAYGEFGYECEEYLKNFDNFFINKCNLRCVSAWKTTVAYNYFRQDLDNLGAKWNRNPLQKEYGTGYFRPNEQIRSTFVDESQNLVNLLEYCTELFNELTEPTLKKNIYNNLAYFTRVPSDQVSYKAMVSTTTNGYGAVMNRTEYYEITNWLTDAAKMSRIRTAKMYDEKEQQAIEEGQRKEREKKANAYWSIHIDEKKALEAEKTALQARLNVLQQEKDSVSGKEQIAEYQKQIDEIAASKNQLGAFKIKEKKALQDKIDAISLRKKELEKCRGASQAEVQYKIDPISKRLEEINFKLENPTE